MVSCEGMSVCRGICSVEMSVYFRKDLKREVSTAITQNVSRRNIWQYCTQRSYVYVEIHKGK